MARYMADVDRLSDFGSVQIACPVCSFRSLLKSTLQPHHLSSLAMYQNHMRGVDFVQEVRRLWEISMR